MKTETGRIVRLAVVFIALLALTLPDAISQNIWDEPPDLVLRPSAPHTIPAGSPVQTRRFEIAAEQAKDRWVRAVDFQPGDPRVVQRAFFHAGKTGQWLGAWVPGQKMVPFPETVAAILPAGSKIVMEVQYRSISEDVKDLSSIALYFTDKKPLRPLTGMSIESRVQIPPNSDLFTLRKEFTVIADSYALALRPEMLAAGRSVDITSMDPSGVSQVLLSVKKHDKDVRPPYVFEEPLFIPKGTRIVAMASYQNFDVEPTEDLFKLTVTMYPSTEYRPTNFERNTVAARRPAARKPAVKKTVPARKAPAKKVPARKR